MDFDPNSRWAQSLEEVFNKFFRLPLLLGPAAREYYRTKHERAAFHLPGPVQELQRTEPINPGLRDGLRLSPLSHNSSNQQSEPEDSNTNKPEQTEIEASSPVSPTTSREEPTASDLALAEFATTYAEEHDLSCSAVVDSVRSALQCLKSSRLMPGAFPSDDSIEDSASQSKDAAKEAAIKQRELHLRQREEKLDGRFENLIARENLVILQTASLKPGNNATVPGKDSTQHSPEFRSIEQAAERAKAYKQSWRRPGITVEPGEAPPSPEPPVRVTRPPSPPLKAAPLEPAFQDFYEAQKRGDTRRIRLSLEARAELEELEAKEQTIRAEEFARSGTSGGPSKRFRPGS